MSHTARDLLQALLDGKTIQRNYDGRTVKLDCNDMIDTQGCSIDISVPEYWVIKPEIVVINGYEVSKPCTTLEMGEEYYHVDTSECHSSTYYTYRGDTLDKQWLENGLCHRTREAADLHLKALLSFTNGDINEHAR